MFDSLTAKGNMMVRLACYKALARVRGRFAVSYQKNVHNFNSAAPVERDVLSAVISVIIQLFYRVMLSVV